ncbi:MAG: response regulator [Spirochaetota bacterium]|nr:response regulator [Spirochaetota bacterium]
MNLKSLTVKTLLTLIITIVLTFSFFLYLSMYSNRNQHLRQINTNGQNAMTRLSTISSILYSHESEENCIKIAERFFYNEMKSNFYIQSITFYATDKSLILRLQRNEDWEIVRVEKEPQFQYNPKIINILKEDVVACEQKIGNIEIILYKKVNNKEVFNKISDFLFTLLFIIIFSSIVTFLFLEISIIHPLKTLIKHIQQYRSSGYVSMTMLQPFSPDDEVGLLIQEFNDLMTDLTKNFEHKAFLIRQLELSNDEMQREVKKRIYTQECERSAQEYMNKVFDLVPAMLVIVDEELMVTQINNQMRKFSGCDSKLENVYLSDILPFTERLTELIFNSLKVREVRTFHCSFNQQYYALTLNPFEHKDGIRAIIRLDDITDTIMKENELFDNFRFENSKKLIGDIMHDFNNLLGGIMGATFLAKLEMNELSEKNGELQDMLNIIETASKRSSNLIKKLSFVSNCNENAVAEVDLKDLLNNILSILSLSIPPEITLNFSDNLQSQKAFILGNIRQLEQIFLGLMFNAVNALTILRESGENWGGEIKVSLSKEVITDKTIFYCVEIQDNGIGISDVQLKSFLDSRNTDVNVTSGLSICKNLIKRHNGYLSVNSQIDKGSVFRVCLPATESKNEVENTENQLLKQESDKTILVIDDNEMLLKVAGQMLIKCGYKVLSADNGEDGIKVFRENPQISVVLLDLIMPGLSGQEVFKQLKEYRNDIAVIFMSGANERKVLTACEGYDGFLTKPYSLNELSRKLFDVLKKSESN